MVKLLLSRIIVISKHVFTFFFLEHQASVANDSFMIIKQLGIEFLWIYFMDLFYGLCISTYFM